MAMNPDSFGQPHNNLILAILDSPIRAAHLLRSGLEPWVVRRQANAPTVPFEASFIDKELPATRSDKLFQVRLRNGRPAFVYVLLEHKSYSDRFRGWFVCGSPTPRRCNWISGLQPP